MAGAEERWLKGDSRIGEDGADGKPLPRRKAPLSTQHNTEKNSSPKLHFRGHSTSGTFTEWICREQSGFANPTFAASTQRWQRSDDTKPDTLEVMRGTQYHIDTPQHPQHHRALRQCRRGDNLMSGRDKDAGMVCRLLMRGK